jgi:hypothetical protein
MSLLRLLAAGRSLVSVRDTESRYRLTSQRLLPHFGPTRNPFDAPGRSELPVAGTTRSAADSGEASPQAGVCNPARRLWLKAAGLLTAWSQELSVLVARPFGKAAKPAIPQLPKPPVQGELSLDRVKVVRNDLSDADLEVVTARTKPAPASLAGKAADRAERAWGRVTGKRFPAGKA